LLFPVWFKKDHGCVFGIDSFTKGTFYDFPPPARPPPIFMVEALNLQCPYFIPKHFTWECISALFQYFTDSFSQFAFTPLKNAIF
jgi:hypothetical protein